MPNVPQSKEASAQKSDVKKHPFIEQLKSLGSILNFIDQYYELRTVYLARTTNCERMDG